jgi:UDP-N-acetylglucosamine 1-carboxyvinyltransferase
MSETIKIIGGKPLLGDATPVPNKNAILANLPACILTDEVMVYKNLPKTTDVIKFLEILKLLGAEVDDADYSNIKICCKNVNSYKVDYKLGNLMRASIMLAGPLLVRFGRAEIPTPGGCVLGKRSIMAHIDSFQKAGVTVEMKDGYAVFTAPTQIKTSYDIWQFEASVTATENLIMYAAGTESEMKIYDCASEPHVTQLVQTLKSMGAEVVGETSNKMIIKGSKTLKGTEFVPEPDFVDIGGMIVAAAITKGKIRIKGANVWHIVGGMIETFRKFNINIKEDGNDLIVDGSNELQIDLINSGFAMAGEDLPKFVPRPWPGFPIDVLPVIVTLASKTKGKLLINNWMYETGLDFVKELNALGANIFIANPQIIVVNGPVKFKGGKITSPDIIQACKAIFLASLADDVETTLSGVEILKRRYPNVLETYRGLGANIEGPLYN